MTALQLFMTWLAARPLRTRVLVYNVVLVIAVLLALVVWVLPLFDVDHLGRLDVDELGSVAILTGGLAALLAKANARPTYGDDDEDQEQPALE